MRKQINKIDKTRNLRQARRRDREKKWLLENGWQSWESLHTALLNGTVKLEVTQSKESRNEPRLN
jgi:hypothetical protein